MFLEECSLNGAKIVKNTSVELSEQHLVIIIHLMRLKAAFGLIWIEKRRKGLFSRF